METASFNRKEVPANSNLKDYFKKFSLDKKISNFLNKLGDRKKQPIGLNPAINNNA